MAETPATASGPSDADAAAAKNAAAMEETASQSFEPLGPLTLRELIDSGVHFGHQTRRWNPRMKPFLFGERNGVHIVDLDQTLPRFQQALEFLRETVARGGKVLFVSTKRQAQAPVRESAERCEQFYVNRRWLGGMLTNFKTVKKSIERFKELLELVGDEEKSSALSKKELSRVNRWIEKYEKSLDGIKEMTRLPDALFVIDVGREAIAVKEASRLGIPIVAVVDSNCDPDDVDYVIPGNDDSLRAIKMYCARAAEACAEGAVVHDERIRAEVAQQEAAKSVEGEKASTGRVVVEIKQQPRRGRGVHSAGGRRDDEKRPEGQSEAPGTPAGTPDKPPASE
jgi:small subunit ribosomal protein S2